MNNEIIARLEEVSNKIESEWNSAVDLWNDDVSKRFDQTYVEPYKMAIRAIIDGSCSSVSIDGTGLIELMQKIDDYARELESLTGVPCVI